MIVRFFGGPWDGETRELPDNTRIWRVPVTLPSEFARLWVAVDREDLMTLAPMVAHGTYTFCWDCFRMHWREPEGNR